ncbi:MAG: hypothetical protein IKS83_07385 [Victivallales bacterium]|nr:hypothetical protein [Victivallales bacterium]
MEADFHSFFSLDDLRNDLEEVAQALLQSCRRGVPRRPIAVCQLKERIVFTLQPSDRPPQDLRFVPLTNPDTPALLAVLQERWMGGYEPVGLVVDENEDNTTQAFLLVQKN